MGWSKSSNHVKFVVWIAKFVLCVIQWIPKKKGHASIGFQSQLQVEHPKIYSHH